MIDFLLMAFIFLVAGVCSVPIVARLGLGSVLGYLIAGILISPLLALIGVDVVAIQHFAEFGVVMMLFLVGLELEPRKLWDMRAKLLGLGGLQVTATAVLVTAAAWVLGQPVTIAIAIGLVLALSSTAIVLQTLNEKGLMKSDGGQSSFSVLLFQDIAVIPMLALIPLLAMPELMDMAGAAAGYGADAASSTAELGAGSTESSHDSQMSLVAGLNGWQTALVTLGAIAAVGLGGAMLTGPLFRFIAVARLRELFVAAALMMIVGIALLMSLVGLSPALGTFLAGVVLANSEYRHELESDIDPFRGLLLGLFFMTVGAGINFALLFDNFAAILALTLGLIALKMAVLFTLGTIFGLRGTDRWLLGLGLAQAGEFGFVLLTFTVANSVIPTAIADQLLLVVALSMLLTPAMFIFYDRVVAPALTRADDREADEIVEHGDIIIAGHGRVGGIVNRMLRMQGYETTVIDFSSAQLDMLRTFGLKVYYGDATRPDLLVSAGIQKAKLFVIAIDEKEQITELARYAAQNWPHLKIVARAVDRNHVYELWAIGCRDIIRDTYDSSLRMGRSALEALGMTHDEAEAAKETFNMRDRKSMIDLADAYDINIPAHENPEYVARVRALVEELENELTQSRDQTQAASEDEITDAAASAKG